MITLTANSPGIEFIRNEADWDTYDAYASLRSLQFDIAEAWYGYAGENLSGFEPGAGWDDSEGPTFDTERADRLYGAMMNAIISRDDVEYWWKVLDRMEELVKLAGRDY